MSWPGFRLVFFVAVLVHGLLAGALYALLALAFVVVYKASRLMNFALGDCVMFAARLAAAGLQGCSQDWPGPPCARSPRRDSRWPSVRPRPRAPSQSGGALGPCAVGSH